MTTDLTGTDTTFDAAPDWADTTDTTMTAFVDYHEHLVAPSPLRRRRVRTALHRTVRFVGLWPSRHGCRRGTAPVKPVMAAEVTDPDATVSFRVVNPTWDDYLRRMQEAAR